MRRLARFNGHSTTGKAGQSYQQLRVDERENNIIVKSISIEY